MHAWHIEEAQSRLSEVIEAAEDLGPQEITMQGRSVAVVLSRSDFDKISGTGESLVAFMRRSPLAGDEGLEFPRDNSLMPPASSSAAVLFS